MNWDYLLDLLSRPLFTLDDKPVTFAKLLLLLAVVVGAVLFSKFVRWILRTRILTRSAMNVGTQYALSRLAGYAALLIGLLVGLGASGIDLTSLTVLIGALGVGIGFGLQDIINNFVSGLVILFERPIQVGHRVEVGDTTGNVERIGARSTTILTNNNIAVIIPNSEFISERVVNWSLGGDRRVRIAVPVGVSYASSPREVERLLLEVAAANPDVLKNHAADVLFVAFGESSIDFELRVWTETESHRPNVLKSALYFAIWDVLAENGIEIPFPQRDLHVKGPLEVRMDGAMATTQSTDS